MGCQTDVAAAILDVEADYVLRVKDNQAGLRADIEQLFARRLARGAAPDHTDIDGGHGRVETRRCWVLDVEDRGMIDQDRWPGLRSVALIETERFVAEPQTDQGRLEGTTETERRYLLSSLPAEAEPILRASRRHWGIENGLHWVLDVAFREDHSQVRAGYSAENVALLRRLAVSVLKRDEQVKAGTQTKRMRAAWDDDYRAHLLQHL